MSNLIIAQHLPEGYCFGLWLGECCSCFRPYPRDAFELLVMRSLSSRYTIK